MTRTRAGHFIFGITQSGNKFRPSDWMERIATVFASYGIDQRLRYNPMVMPVVYDGLPCLFVDSHFVANNPGGCQFITDFVTSNKLQVKTIAAPQHLQCNSKSQLKDVA